MREPLPTAELDAARHSPDSLSEAIRRADLAALWRAISELPHQQREALLLREFGGLTYEELGEALAVTGAAVESLLFRARQGLRARLQTAYAAVSGASLAEALARLLAGASGSAAPVVAKTVAAAGVGAALATGGVVVAPHVFHHDAAHPRVVPITPSRQTAVVARRAPALVANRVQADDRGSSSGSGRSSGDRPDSSAGSADEQQRTTEHDGQVVSSAGDQPSDVASGSSPGSDGSGGGDGSGSGDTSPQPVTTIVSPGDGPPSGGD